MYFIQILFTLSLNHILLNIAVATDLKNNTSDVPEEGRYLLYPHFSSLQFAVGTSSILPLYVPKKKYPIRQLGMSFGFGVWYKLPYRLKDFYSFPTWARVMVDVVKGRYFPSEVITARSTRRTHFLRPLSAGDVYIAIEGLLEFSGYGKDCFIKSVCELAHSPFYDLEEDLYAEIIHFLLTPSEHQAFDLHERKMQHKYESAERFGKMGADCNIIFPNCRRSFLMNISDFLEDNNLD
ncbi:uncharacterized protein LOC134222131 [Armigeres subalbatus]|uniref:uncharacterized protein LOC134222131 n=1 Tax=Armigeres subalbatus TaxID=124917 RepID=UPI002ED037ED